jgi:hypothetical protein
MVMAAASAARRSALVCIRRVLFDSGIMRLDKAKCGPVPSALLRRGGQSKA